MPLLAVAEELRRRGHQVVFIGTRQGLEARLVPQAGFDIEWIEIGGLQRVGLRKALRTLWQLPSAILRSRAILRHRGVTAVLSLGGFVAGPVVAASVLCGVPLVAMEPNALPGFTHRLAARWVRAALLAFPETARWFPEGRARVAGVPVRAEFFQEPAREETGPLTVLVTGGSQGSRTLNQATAASWPLFEKRGPEVHFRLQCGPAWEREMTEKLTASGIQGSVEGFLEDMPAAFREADIVISRSGGSTVAELAASAKPSILVPFPFAADDHQRRNAEAMERAGAARVVPNAEMDGERLWREVSALAGEPDRRASMSRAARLLARPDAARQAAETLEGLPNAM